jgi:hypothetical protein
VGSPLDAALDGAGWRERKTLGPAKLFVR